MYTLNYLRTLDVDKLKEEYNYNRSWQLKWFDIYEEYHKQGKRDRMVAEHLEYYTKRVNKIVRVMEERGV